MPSEKIRTTFTFEGRRYVARGNTKAEADANALLMKMKLESGSAAIESTMKVNDWFEQYMSIYKSTAAKKTIRDYRGFYTRRIAPEIGNMPLRAVKTLHCQKIVNNMSKYSASYGNKVIMLLKSIFRQAVSNNLISRNPADNVIIPEMESGERRALTTAERKKLQAVWNDIGRAGLYAKVIYYCGLRPSEVLRIKGKDIQGDILHVPGKKTKNADRRVPIPKALVLPKISKEDLLFPSTKHGGEMGPDAERYFWKVIRNAMNAPEDLTAYCLRHDYCTRLQEAGVPIDVARRLMGHSSIELTSRIYTHASEITIEQARLLINKRNQVSQ